MVVAVAAAADGGGVVLVVLESLARVERFKIQFWVIFGHF